MLLTVARCSLPMWGCGVVDQAALDALHVRQACECAQHILDTATEVLRLMHAGAPDVEVAAYIGTRDIEAQMMQVRHFAEGAQLAAPPDDAGVVLRRSTKALDLGALNVGRRLRVEVRRG